ncbi:MBL fold metallo-hydrolase [Puia dinghuensis]|uniref:MBL fold metallo-hydrolase n=1 Tax=Puia dinghuensis TaxID=1792502 RepID=A0A8J2UCY2_9BACT|nr:MBL fold metallo-hydrolase [Puia dinghuensis]GGB00151.1 MBL fold metallo-hydrolase [Puia dinghuensis]
MALLKVFGKAPAGPRLQRIHRSAHYSDGSFQNLVPTDVTLKDTNFFKMMRAYRNRPANTAPSQPIPSVRTDLRSLPVDKASIVWFGHSSYLLQLGTTRILVDPVFSGNASPFPFFAKAFPGADLYKAEDMPDTLEAILLTHDHYDHLDYKTILNLKDRTNHFYTSLGVGAHLEFWGIPAEKITELDWWETVPIDPQGRPITGGAADWGAGDIQLTATPARHFSGRTFKRGGAAWSSFVLKTTDLNLFLGGDSGYEKHFATIGEKYGPFDLALLECGQYGVNWPYIHMQPEETVQAALDLKANILFPVHWAKFTLALHPWNEPIQRVKAAATKAGLPITTPRIGEIITIDQPYPNDAWYDFL